MMPCRRPGDFDNTHAHQTESADRARHRHHEPRAASRKPFEPGRVRRQQQWLLYGSRVAIAVFVLVCAARGAQLGLQESIAHDQPAFLVRKADLMAEMAVVRTLQNRHVENFERMSRHQPVARPDALGGSPTIAASRPSSAARGARRWPRSRSIHRPGRRVPPRRFLRRFSSRSRSGVMPPRQPNDPGMGG